MNETRSPETWLRLITARRAEFQPLYTRMDADRDLLYGRPYQMTAPDGRVVPDVYHVTLTEPALYAAKCTARLASVSRQTVVESEALDDRATSRIESFLEDVACEVDARLARKGELDEFAQYCELVCVRGPIACQVVTRAEGGSYIPDVRPLDTRYLAYDLDADGVAWAALFMTRAKSDIESEYEVKVRGATAEVIDLWTKERELTWLDGKLVKNEAHGYDICPFVIQWPAAGSVLRDRDSLKRRGESIFYLLRTDAGKSLYEEKNYVASLLKTQSAETLVPPLQFPTPPEGEYQTLPEKYPGPGEMLQVRSPAQLVPKPDVRTSTHLYMGQIDRLIQEATFNTIDFGSATFPLSAVAMARLSEGRNELLLPRLQAIAYLYQQRARLLIRQFQALGQTLKLGEEGHKRAYKPGELNGEYVVKFRCYTTSKQEMAADLSLAAAAASWYSEDYIMRELLRVQNPDGMMAARRAEQAERADPVITLYKQMHGLIDEATEQANLQAWLILERITGILKQRKLTESQPLQGDIAQGARPPQPQPAPPMPMFGAGKAAPAKEAQSEAA